MESLSESGRVRRRYRSGSWLDSSIDFPTYIPWNNLSTDYSSVLRGLNCQQNIPSIPGSPGINRICEQTETTRLINDSHDGGDRNEFINSHGEPITGVTWYGAVFLLVNTALGAGVLNYPQAYDKAGGIMAATFIQILLLVTLTATMLILCYCSDINGDTTYHDVLLSVVGRRAQQLGAMSILLTCFGICTTFLIIIGDQYDSLFMSMYGDSFCSHWYLHRKFTITVTSCLLIFPMSFPKRIDFLKYFSSLGVLTMLFTVFLVIYQYFVGGHKAGEIKTQPTHYADVLFILPVFCFAYQTHEVVVPVYACMKNKSMRAFSISTIVSMSLLFVIYSATGICGYLTFGNTVSADIMKSYDASSPFVLIGMAVLTLKMVTTYPPLVLCGRGAIDGLYCEFRGLNLDDIVLYERRRRFVITIVWFMSTLLLSLFIPNIGIVLESLGSLASCNVFIFPGLCLMKVCMRRHPVVRSSSTYVALSFGFFLMMIGVVIFSVVVINIFLQGNHSNVQSAIVC